MANQTLVALIENMVLRMAELLSADQTDTVNDSSIGINLNSLIFRSFCAVGVVLPLEEQGWAALDKYFDHFLQPSLHISKL